MVTEKMNSSPDTMVGTLSGFTQVICKMKSVRMTGAATIGSRGLQPAIWTGMARTRSSPMTTPGTEYMCMTTPGSIG